MKKMLTSLMLISSITLCLGTAKEVNAAETITNINTNLNQIGEYYYKNNLARTKMDGMYELDKKPLSVYSRADLDVDPNSNNLKLKQSVPNLIYVGDNVFNNTTDTDQSYVTTNYSKAVTQTVTTTTTKGFNLNGQGLQFKLPLFIGKNKITATFNSGTTKTNTDTIVETITSGSQPVKVPAHKKYKVIIHLEEFTFNGTFDYKANGTNLYNDITAKGMWIDRGGTPYRKTYNFHESVGYEWNNLNSSQKANINEIKINPSNNSMTVDGSAEVTGTLGTRMVVKTYDITHGENNLVRTEAIE
ncbi:ETX/MTX2 family pore-forming toxin [Bacillus wiedmannii]|uniref:ETX/MTX2 family pore-forming toxin n=1 Tax=Bacillus wiedmannii TaxID=1890302 RepID=UPI0024AE12A5|nr:ETX/MTX2 family pore-forming toxin [Bacillus wiedmannii]MDI6680275.1 ETX/MTX2 family pore-forming toxin [Bacillus wiedmannii]